VSKIISKEGGPIHLNHPSVGVQSIFKGGATQVKSGGENSRTSTVVGKEGDRDRNRVTGKNPLLVPSEYEEKEVDQKPPTSKRPSNGKISNAEWGGGVRPAGARKTE